MKTAKKTTTGFKTIMITARHHETLKKLAKKLKEVRGKRVSLRDATEEALKTFLKSLN